MNHQVGTNARYLTTTTKGKLCCVTAMAPPKQCSYLPSNGHFPENQQKIYHPIDKLPPVFIQASHKKGPRITRSSPEHRIKGFADDLTLISVDKQ